MAGITQADQRHASTVDGRISALIELGAGFHPEISGRENVFINGIMLGLTKKEVERRFDEIVEFAEMQDFIDAPVKTYSSGMYMRLGFAVAIHVDPDVLLVDEVLAVGDEGFTHKCLDKFAEFRRREQDDPAGDALARPGREVLRRGAVARQGPDARPRAIPSAWWRRTSSTSRRPRKWSCRRRNRRACAATASGAPARRPTPGRPTRPSTGEAPTDMFKATEGRWGTREVEITGVTLLGGDGQPGHVFQSGEAVRVQMNVRAHHALKDFVFGFGIFNADGVCCYGTNTNLEELQPDEISGEGVGHASRSTASTLVEGTYRSTSRPTSSTAIPTTTTGCSTPSA